MFRKFALTALGACLLFATESANATSAEAGVRCVAVAERINGTRPRERGRPSSAAAKSVPATSRCASARTNCRMHATIPVVPCRLPSARSCGCAMLGFPARVRGIIATRRRHYAPRYTRHPAGPAGAGRATATSARASIAIARFGLLTARSSPITGPANTARFEPIGEGQIEHKRGMAIPGLESGMAMPFLLAISKPKIRVGVGYRVYGEF
jgi:hypothetical protein